MAAQDAPQVVVTGVSGVGKTTVAQGLSRVLGWTFAEGDAFHSPANVATMASGHPLTDDDRLPWLQAIGGWLDEQIAAGRASVVTCSALRRAYRDLLREGRPQVSFLHLDAGKGLVADRLGRRTDHYMPVSLLHSQYDTLEPLEPGEPGVSVPVDGSPSEVLRRALAALGPVARAKPVEAADGQGLDCTDMEITSGSAVLSAESAGSGPDVLLLHAGVTDRRSWASVVDGLPGHRCLSYDARGYGRTTYEPEDGWSPVDDAVAVLDAYDVERAVVVGCSMGGRTALDLALTHPERVRALALIGTAVSGAPDLDHLEPGLEDLEQRYDAAYEAKDLDELNRLEAEIWLDGPFVPGRVTGPARDLFLDMNRIALEAPEPGEQRPGVDAWTSCGEIAVPTLVLIGEHDLAHTHRNAAHLAETVPGARLVDLPGVAHLPHLERDERTLAEIAAFVAAH